MGSETAEVWGYALFAATLVSMGSTWLVFAVLGPLVHSGSPAIDPFYAVFPAVFLALGAYVAWKAQLEYKKRQRNRTQPSPPPVTPSQGRVPP